MQSALMSDIFTFAIDFENIQAGFSYDQPTTYIGRVKIHADGPTTTGGNRAGALNLGFRVRDKISGDVIFEDRAFLLASTLTPDHWTGFTINIPALERTVHDAQLMLDFVREAEFWFHERGSEVVVAELHAPRVEIPAPALAPLPAPGAVPAPALADPAPLYESPQLRHSRARAPATAIEQNARYVFDISDLMQFWRDNVRPTGIQRVQIEVLRSIIEREIEPELAEAPFTTIFFDGASHSWKSLPNERLLQQIKTSYTASITKEIWLIDLDEALLSARNYTPMAGDAIINLGSSWWIPDYLHKVQRLRLEYGIRYIPFIHDAIPLVTPEFCDAGLVDEFRLWFRGAVSIADHIIVNSSSSGNDVDRCARELTGDCSAISIARLNAAFPQPETMLRTGIIERLNLDIERYVLCVGTLEARKNHALLFQIWSDLARMLPRERVPKLVLVGKEGWMFDLARAVFSRDPALKELVLKLNNLSDQELADLYRGALFTVYPSFYEGWGLPVTEAVSYGKLTVASNNSSVPEAASRGDILIDPHDQSSWRDTILRLVSDDAFLTQSTRISRERADVRRWADVANDILEAARTSVRAVAEQNTTMIQDGTIYDFRIVTARKNYDCSALPFRSGAGWHHLEEWGAWSAPGVTELKFRVATTTDRYLYLVVKGGMEPLNVTLTVDRKTRMSREIASDNRVIFRADIGSSPRNEHVIRMIVHNPVNLALKTGGADNRQIGVGFLNMVCVPHADISSRLNFLEAMQMHFV